MRGRAEVRASVAGTVTFVVVAVAAALWPDDLVDLAVAVDLALFAAGCVAFAASYALAVARSRHDELSVAGLWLLAGGPGTEVSRGVRGWLLGSLGVEVVVAVATAWARPYSGLAFGILVPTYGLGLVGLWAVRHGRFPPRAG